MPLRRTLATRQLEHDVRALAVAAFPTANVDSKLNSRGAYVIGIVIPAERPGQWEEPAVDREAKREAEKWRR